MFDRPKVSTEKILGFVTPHLLIFYFITFFYTNNIGDFDFENCLIIFVIISGIVFPIQLSLQKIIKNSVKSNLVLLILLIGFFTFGNVNLLLNDYDIEIGKYRFLLPIYLGIISIVFYCIIKYELDIKKISKVMVTTVLMMIILSFMNLQMYETHYESTEYNSLTMSKINDLFKNDERVAPDIFYIVPDEYPGDENMSKHFGVENNDFNDYLKNHNFKIYEAYSNYHATLNSIPSTFNMEYIDPSFNQKTNPMHTKQEIDNSNFIRFLKYFNYKISTASSYSMDNNLDSAKNYCSSLLNIDLIKNISQATVLQIFTNDILEYLSKDRLCVFTIHEDLILDNENPNFVYIHLPVPHRDFNQTYYSFLDDENYLDEVIYNDEILDDEVKKNFMRNLKFSNTLLMKMIDKILLENNNSIIIINGDHGFRGEITNRGMGNEIRPVSFNELISDYNTILAVFSQTEIDFPPQVSNVNVFRIIINQIFEQELEILDDEFYLLCKDSGQMREIKEFEDSITCP